MGVIENDVKKVICNMYDAELDKYENINELFKQIGDGYEFMVYNQINDEETLDFQRHFFNEIVKNVASVFRGETLENDIKEFILNPGFKMETEILNNSLDRDSSSINIPLQDAFAVRKVSSNVVFIEDTKFVTGLSGPKLGLAIKVDRILIKDSPNMAERAFIVNVEKINVDLRRYDIILDAVVSKYHDKNIEITPIALLEIENKARLHLYMTTTLENSSVMVPSKKDINRLAPKIKEKNTNPLIKNAFVVKNWYEFIDNFYRTNGVRLDEYVANEDGKYKTSRWTSSDYVILDNRKKRKGGVTSIYEQYKKTIPATLKKIRN